MDSVVRQGGDEIRITVPCKTEYVRTVRRAIAEFATLRNMPRPDVEEVEVAASEAVANVVRHAYPEAKRAPRVRVRCYHRKDGLTVEVADKGRGFDAPPDTFVPELDFDREGGMGITLMKQLMDRVTFVSKPDVGTKIKMTKRVREAVSECALALPKY